MNNNESIESKLERLSETVSLRADEKAAHRENLRAFMAKSRKPVPSPYSRFFVPATRAAFAFVMLLVVSTGVVSAAEGSYPGDPLYIVKLKVTEPARSALTIDPEEKTEFEVERVDRRLKELAVFSSSEDPDPETMALIGESLSGSIADVAEDVSDFSATGEGDEALKANADLQSTLSAHQLILERIEERHPELAEDFDAISDSVDAGLASTENIEQAIEDALEPALAEDDSVDGQAAETEASLLELKQQLSGSSHALDALDQETVAGSLAEVEEILEEARTAGDRRESYLLYTEADQRLNELRTLVEADLELGIGVIDSDIR